MNYYISINGAQQGPFSAEQLAAQRLRPETLVWAEGMAQWERADRVLALRSVLAQPAAAPGNYAAPGSYAAPGAYAAAQPAQGAAPYGYAAQGAPIPYGGYPAPVAQPAMADAANKKMAAGICGILWGSLGVHKFILGYTSAGVIMLCLTVFTCGVGGIVMHIISIIEGIMYLSKTDAEFYQTYMVQKKEWF